MKKCGIIVVCAYFVLPFAHAQQQAKSSVYVEAGVAANRSALSGIGAIRYDWHLGKKRRFVVGTGVRFTTFSAESIGFITAPAHLTTNRKNLDTLFVTEPRLNSLNVLINLGWRFSEKLQIGFDIDAAGISLGSTEFATYVHNDQPERVQARPSSPNLLLLDDRNRGSVSAQYHVLYRFGPHFGAKVGLQHLFSELKTDTKVQTLPEANDRFRYKSYAGFVGLNYTF